MARRDEESFGGGIVSPASPDLDNEKDLERLGRQKPAVLSTYFIEAAFVFSVVGSMMMSEYFVRPPAREKPVVHVHG